jgi:hypothetical protein
MDRGRSRSPSPRLSRATCYRRATALTRSQQPCPHRPYADSTRSGSRVPRHLGAGWRLTNPDCWARQASRCRPVQLRFSAKPPILRAVQQGRQGQAVASSKSGRPPPTIMPCRGCTVGRRSAAALSPRPGARPRGYYPAGSPRLHRASPRLPGARNGLTLGVHRGWSHGATRHLRGSSDARALQKPEGSAAGSDSSSARRNGHRPPVTPPTRPSLGGPTCAPSGSRPMARELWAT